MNYTVTEGNYLRFGLQSVKDGVIFTFAGEKEDVDVTEQEWFREAVGKMENFHFSTPHVQNLFDDGTQQYYLSLIHI